MASESTSGVGTYSFGQPPSNLFDGNLNTRFSSRGSAGNNDLAGLNTGFYMTIAQCQPVLTGFRFGNVYNASDREPILITIEGTNCADVETCTNWTLLYNNGSTGLDVAKDSLDYGEYRSITNNAIYQSYRFLVTAKRDISAFVSYSEVELFGSSSQTSTTTTSSKFS